MGFGYVTINGFIVEVIQSEMADVFCLDESESENKKIALRVLVKD
jgi:hypothetical protein